jgi:hypothetical protein
MERFSFLSRTSHKDISTLASLLRLFLDDIRHRKKQGTKQASCLSYARETGQIRKETTMKRTLISMIMAAVVSAAPAFGHGRPVPAGDVSIEIVSDSGRMFRSFPLREYRKQDTLHSKQYLEAGKGENYGIVIRNNTAERVGIVIAVDGRNIITGAQSDLKNNEAMYIVNPGEQARYDGWRTTDSEVRWFYFTDPADSYSERTFGDSSAMGVIAAAVYREKARYRPLPGQSWKKEAPAAAPSSGSESRSAGKALADESAGTGFGDSQYSPVVRVEFEPERRPIRKTLIKYEWRETLCRKGIIQCPGERENRLWDSEEYAPYPPGYPIN